MLRRDVNYLDEVHVCPHCDQNMSCCEAPPVHIGDGLGWGSDVMFICLNDYCKLFLEGWETIEQRYGHHASYRYMELPDSKEGNYMMVGNSDAFKASVINPQVLKEQNQRYQEEKKATMELENCLEEKNIEPVLHLILDEAADIINRKKAISMLAVLNDLSCIDPIRNHKFRDTSLEMECNQILELLLKKNLKKECPYCSELVKMQAKKCLHCKEDLE
jgi:hypothetical protein